MLSNYEAAVKAEAKKVARIFLRASVDELSRLQSHRRSRNSRVVRDRGHFMYVHPALTGVCFTTRGQAAKAALAKAA